MTPIRWVVVAGICVAGVLAPMACSGGDSGGPASDAGADHSLADDRSLADNRGDEPETSFGEPDAAFDAAPAVLLATVPYPGVSSFAIDSTSLYWTTSYTGTDGGIEPRNGTVSKCPIAGCAGDPTVLATSQAYPQSLVVHGTNLYWLDYSVGALMRCGIDCADDAKALHTWPEIWLGDFAVSDTEAFFSGANGVDTVEQCPLSGCDSSTTFASNQPTPKDLAVAASNLVWIDYGTVVVGRKVMTYVDGGLMTCPVTGCDGGATLASGLSYPSGLAVQDDTAYWVQGTTIVACDVAGCGGAPAVVTPFPQGVDSVAGLAVDATDVYFGGRMAVDGFVWQIWRCSRSGCPRGPTQLMSTPSAAGIRPDIAVDATRIYFVSVDGTRILALDK